MTNNSSTGGILVPERVSYIAPMLDGDALVNFFQNIFKQLLTLDGKLVRPRWQLEPPNLPTNATNWMAFAITDQEGDTNSVNYHLVPSLDQAPRELDQDNPDGSPEQLDPPSYDIVMRNEAFNIPCSLYGPDASLNASLLREGFSVPQNREILQLNGIGHVGAGVITAVPTLVNEKWYNRVDITLMFRRNIRRVYPILDIASADATLNTDISPITREIIINNN